MTVDPKTIISIALPAEEWNVVLDVLSDGRFKVVGPLIQKIVDQAQKSDQPPEDQKSPQRLMPVS